MSDGVVGNEIAMWVMKNYPGDVGVVVTVFDTKANQFAKDNDIPNFVFKSEEQIANEVANIGVLDLGILAWWPKIISPRMIELTENGFINTHPSLLPYNRGKHYNFWALVEQSPFGVSLHYVTTGIDDGDIVAQQRISYDWEDTGASLYVKACTEMVKLFKTTYKNIRSGNIQSEPQDLTKGSFHYANEIDDASKIALDNNYSARDLINLLRARTFEGHPACSFEDGNKTYEVRIKIERK